MSGNEEPAQSTLGDATSEEADAAVASLDALPSGVLDHIFCFVDVRNVPALAVTCKQLRTVQLHAPASAFCSWFFQTLNIKYFPTEVPQDALGDHTWVQVLLSQYELWAKLSELPSPGCQYQKYLRWMEGEPACSYRVRIAIFASSLLPASLSECFVAVKTNRGTTDSRLSNRVQLALRIMFTLASDDHLVSQPWSRLTQRPPAAELAELAAVLDLPRYLSLLAWFIEGSEGQALRIRQLMAEVGSIKIRGIENFITRCWDEPPASMAKQGRMPSEDCRQTLAFRGLHMLSTMPEAIEYYWARR